MPIPDTCIITASDEHQASVFRVLLERRIAGGLYPREIDWRVVSDSPAGRAGSAGATVLAILSLLRDEGLDLLVNQPSAGVREAAERLSRRRILVIHAGGESRRLPTYVPEGKLFAPVPVPSSSFVPPVVLDVELSLFLRYPWREGELLVTSGDVLVDFNTDMLNLTDAPLCGFAAPDSFERGSNHGVFSFDPLTGAVKDYYQKGSPEELARKARIEGTESCAIDLGIVSFRDRALHAILSLAAEPLSGGSVAERIGKGALSIDLYLEVLTACLANLDKVSYRNRLRGSATSAEVLDLIFEQFHPCGLAGALVRQPTFIHFGSASEFPAACRDLRTREILPFYALAHEELLPDVGQYLVRQNCIDAEVQTKHGGSYVENCRSVKIFCEGENLFVGLRDFSINSAIPTGICLDGRRFEDGGSIVTVLLVYHRDDTFKPQANPKDVFFCARPLPQWLDERGLSLDDIINDHASSKGSVDLYEAALFAILDVEHLEGYWRVPPDKEKWSAWFRKAKRFPLGIVNARSDAGARDDERAEARRIAIARGLSLGGFIAVPAHELADLVSGGFDATSLVQRLEGTDEPLLREYRRATLLAAGVPGVQRADRVEVSFSHGTAGAPLRCATKLDQIVWARAPVRLDLAGGWTDTPPYTNRYGGAVVNVAVDLNGQSPIQVFARRTPELQLTLHSIDLGLTEVIRDTGGLRRHRDLESPFSLPRAALGLIGLGASEPDGAPLGPIFKAAGGGLELTLLCAVPKGSGLGTSSILAGTILAALERFYGKPVMSSELFLQVLEVEQMLTTGGGWQDQIGGLVGGLKFIESRPALKPRPIIHQLDPWIFEAPECIERMTLFYTGVTRLAKGILRDVVDRVNGMGRECLFTHGRLRELASEARNAVSLRDLTYLSRILGETFKENKMIHASTTNDAIEAMIVATSPHFSGMKLLGAGGGGFALFVSPNAMAANTLRSLLVDRFEDERARLVGFSINKTGLEVTVS